MKPRNHIVGLRSIKKNHSRLEKNIDTLIKYGLNLITSTYPALKKHFSNSERNMLLEGLLLRACAYWESFLESELIFLIDLDQTKLKSEFEIGKSTKLADNYIHAMIFSDGYKDFTDIDRSIGYFRKYISDKLNLFEEISGEQKKILKYTYALRNYLAHYSKFAKKKLTHQYSIYNIKKFTEPGVVLRKKKAKIFEELVHNFNLMSSAMKFKLKRI